MANHTVLLVDDEQSVIDAISRMLKRKTDWHILQANNGKQALALLEKQTIDLVLSDMRMPEMDGLELILTIAQQYPHVKRLVLTGYADVNATIQAISQGQVLSYITKPWSNDKLLETLNEALNGC